MKYISLINESVWQFFWIIRIFFSVASVIIKCRKKDRKNYSTKRHGKAVSTPLQSIFTSIPEQHIDSSGVNERQVKSNTTRIKNVVLKKKPIHWRDGQGF